MPLAAQVAAIIDMAPGTATHTGSSVKLTYDGLVHFPDGGKRHVLIDREHYVTPSPNTAHQAVSGNLHSLIRTWLEMHPDDISGVSTFSSLRPGKSRLLPGVGVRGCDHVQFTG